MPLGRVISLEPAPGGFTCDAAAGVARFPLKQTTRQLKQRQSWGQTRWVCLVATLATGVISQGCQQQKSMQPEESAPPFSFRALDLQQRTRQGLPAWSLKSPEARYDLRSSVARALRPEGVIFEKGKPLYKLSATTGTVINDGAVILLEGNIRLQRLGKDPLLLSANRALWIPRDSLMRFELGPNVRNLQTQLSAQTASLLLEKDLLELRGEPTIQRWERPLAITTQTSKPAPEIQGTFKEVDWRPGQGDLKGMGPVRMTRRPPGRGAQIPPQLLKGSRLEGNTVQQAYTLFGPVEFMDPGERSWFRGAFLDFNTKDSQIKTNAAFLGQIGNLHVQGEKLLLDGKASSASIQRNCQLRQDGDQLTAQRCLWNWKSQGISAEGQVLYRRLANDQLTRADRMEGKLGSMGGVKATTPNGRVFSQLRVPRQAAAPKPERARPKRPPIEF
ncbi:MAG: LPS export ABC transporter periplasmic protein LptC [Cyanobacteriota bacterium]|nr:LPS export ABC transporter periplasmic protein LptC [Cyanobacteriota bacterium]